MIRFCWIHCCCFIKMKPMRGLNDINIMQMSRLRILPVKIFVSSSHITDYVRHIYLLVLCYIIVVFMVVFYSCILYIDIIVRN